MIECRVRADVDIKKWAELYDTDGQKISEVRKDIRTWMRETVIDAMEDEGLLLLDPDGKPVTNLFE
ncbi:hypothetical protein KHQ86_gp119 [Gordonia phage Stormageddon]|uniref:Uncharacterized protein n=1 Tax=Gordonia phage Stormageddon TaxID=2656541 RepID=A0A649VS17_9CAUD|nr:hypothetical protein KHQ86_gp119 [Gordonia phage Stormageddon]QGJ95041.1 hypothetical protein SEA_STORMAGEDDON_181 [Gordonia phage Stormageddon]